MAESINPRTQSITRDRLAQALGNNPQLIKLIENLVQDMTVTVPDATDTLLERIDAGAIAGNLAQAIATAAMGLASQLAEGPPVAPPVPAPDDVPPAQPVVLPEIPDDLTARISSLTARVAVLERQLSELREGPTP